MISKIRYIAFVSLLILSSCTEKFFPDIKSENTILVVDGKVTNQSGPYELRLFRTVDLTKTDSLTPEEDAIITIYDDQGNSDSYTEIQPGVYHTLSGNFKGEIGRSYWIEISTIDGSKFESIPEMISPPINIDTVYGETGQILRNDASTFKAVKFYLDATAPTAENNYLRWEYKENYEWHTPFYEPKTDNPSKICYPTRNSDNIFVLDATKQYDKIIQHLETGIVSEFEVKLNYQYLLQLSLYTISFQNYQFWKTVKQTNDENSGLYGVIPTNAYGNICTFDSKTLVIGYFEASSVSKKHQFFSKDDFDLEFEEFPSECNEIHIRMEDGYPDKTKYHVISYTIDDNAVIFIVRPNFCYDCNVKYSPNKPSFWP